VIDNTLRILSKFRHLPPLWQAEYYKATYPVFSHPVDMRQAWITQRFGANPASYAPLKGHDGIDYGQNVGLPVICPVEWMKITDLILQKNSYGRHAWGIDEFGHRYIFGHLHSFECEKGQEFSRGQIFATSGGNLDDPYHGYSTGPHLHSEWRPVWASISNGYAGAENQEPYITFGDVVPVIPEPLFWMINNTGGLRYRSSPKIVWNNLTGKNIPKGERVPVYQSDLLDGRLFVKTDKGYLCYKENETIHMVKE
jgi:murein DD-endopeptidase MepM/ murein hydrolase activator NlpD